MHDEIYDAALAAHKRVKETESAHTEWIEAHRARVAAEDASKKARIDHQALMKRLIHAEMDACAAESIAYEAMCVEAREA